MEARMIPAETLTELATIGLSRDQAEAVSRMLRAVEDATRSEGAAAIEARRSNDRARSARYIARGGGNIQPDLRAAVFERDGYACVYCGSQDYLQCDHVEPVSKGGPTTLENLATACRVCNARKKDRDRKAFVRGLSKEVRGQNRKSEDNTPIPSPPRDIINPPNPSPVSSLRSETPAKLRNEVLEILREAVCDGTAAEIVAHRKALKSPLTAGAARGLVKAWREFGDPEAAAAAQMANGWKGFTPSWMENQKARAGPAQTHRTWTAALAANAFNREIENEPQTRSYLAGEERGRCQDVLALSVSAREGPCGNGHDDLGLSGDDEGFSFGPILKRM
jgi:5-methylcytosine-specific restriction endonuclease McrA